MTRKFRTLRIATIVLLAGPAPKTVFANSQKDLSLNYQYTVNYQSPSEHVLIIHYGDDKSARYFLKECWMGSSETGAFPILGTREPSPFVGVLCQTNAGFQSLFIFAPEENVTEPIYAIKSKLDLDVRVTNTAGLQAKWMEPTEINDTHYAIWEPNHGMAHSQRFFNAREPAFGKRVRQLGVLPDGLTPGDYVMTHSPYTPIRLGPSEYAPWFQRSGTDLMIHLFDGDLTWYGSDIWKINGWLRVCLVEGGCGYVTEDAILQLR